MIGACSFLLEERMVDDRILLLLCAAHSFPPAAAPHSFSAFGDVWWKVFI
jgi:hypothetical protein